MKNLCIFCPVVWRLDQISGTVRPCNWSSPEMVPLSRPPVFVPNSTLVTCLLEEFWAGRWQSPPKAVLNLNLSDLLLRKPEIYIAERKTSQKNVEPRCKSDSKFTKLFPPKNIDKWQKLNAITIAFPQLVRPILSMLNRLTSDAQHCSELTWCWGIAVQKYTITTGEV